MSQHACIDCHLFATHHSPHACGCASSVHGAGAKRQRKDELSWSGKEAGNLEKASQGKEHVAWVFLPGSNKQNSLKEWTKLQRDVGEKPRELGARQGQ